MNIYSNSSFDKCNPHQYPGRKIPVDILFTWADTQWKIPVIYQLDQGFVLDICKKISNEKVRSFLEKWNQEERTDSLTNEEAEQMEQENPFSILFSIEATVNGAAQREGFSMWSLGWFSGELPEVTEETVEMCMEEYRCSRSESWFFIRAVIPWKEKKARKPEHFAITMVPQPVVCFCEPHVVTSLPCAPFDLSFQNPVTRESYRLHVSACEAERLEDNIFRELDTHGMEYPENYCVLEYTVTPEKPDETIILQDCGRTDTPRMKEKAAGAVTVITGESGPVSVFLAGKSSSSISGKKAVSCLYFHPVEEVEWRISIQRKEWEPETFRII